MKPLKKTINLIVTLGVLLVFNIGFSQDGKLISKQLIDVSQTPIWDVISENNKLKTEYQHIHTLDFFTIKYISDGLTIKGFLIEPKKEGVYPVIIFNRGGNRDFGRLTVVTMIMYTSKLAEQGYVVVGSNYREIDEFGGKEINDVLALTETVKEIHKADPNKIGMFGWSRGGMMTYLALKESKKIKTAVIGNGASNLFDTLKFRPEMETNVFAECIPNYWDNKEIELKNRSAIYWADELNKESSLLILTGTNDKRVNPKQAYDMADLLNEIDYNYELQKHETDHFFSDKKEVLNQILIDWFKKKLL